ncbi:MAG: FAD-binding oxidoreductase [Gemmatimonadaceae bacterium]
MTFAERVLRPVTTPSAAAEQVRETVRYCLEHREALLIRGRGHWYDAGRPRSRDGVAMSTGTARGIVEYNPGDLTLTAFAGTTLGDIAAATREHGQWLALDPFGPETGTIGATVATASYGPLAHAFGTPRDNVLGVEFVTGTAEVVRGGGRVVKNVAGFDLARLVTGAWGTLGVITEVTVRLRALPAVDETVALHPPEGDDALADLLARLREAPIAPLSLELLNAPLARRVGAGDGAVVLARLGGNAALVRAQQAALSALGGARPVDAAVWSRLRTFEPEGVIEGPSVVARLSARPTELAALWREAREVGERLGGGDALLAHATVGRGVVRVAARIHEHNARVEADPERDEAIRGAFSVPRGRHVVYERLPAALWPELAPSAVSDRLSRGVRDAFDPHRILNPGILGE